MANGCKINNTLSISRLNTFFKRTFPSGYAFKGEYHDFHEVVCVLSGCVGITSGKRVYELCEGEMTVHTPGEFHAIREEKNNTPTVIIFSFTTLSFPVLKENIFSLNKECLSEIEKIYTEICSTVNKINGEQSWICSSVEGKELNLTLLVKRLELFLLTAFQSSVDASSRQISDSFYKILSVMEANINASLSVSEIAEKCKMSVPSLEKTMHKYIGYGAMEHYNIMKMRKAQTMLLEGKSVKDVSLSLGFSNQNYFSARFKKHFGCAPSRLKP